MNPALFVAGSCIGLVWLSLLLGKRLVERAFVRMQGSDFAYLNGVTQGRKEKQNVME